MHLGKLNLFNLGKITLMERQTTKMVNRQMWLICLQSIYLPYTRLFDMEFLKLFPKGEVNYLQRNMRNMHLHEYVKHLIKYVTIRFEGTIILDFVYLISSQDTMLKITLQCLLKIDDKTIYNMWWVTRTIPKSSKFLTCR